MIIVIDSVFEDVYIIISQPKRKCGNFYCRLKVLFSEKLKISNLRLFLGKRQIFLKTQETQENTNRTKLFLFELNSIGNTLKVKYKFGVWQTL